MGKSPESLPPYRRGFLLLVLGGIVAAHAFCLATLSERWPFSHYAMFAGRPDPEWVRLFKMVGVTDEPTPRLLSLGIDWRYLQPLNERLLNEELGRLANKPNGEELLRVAAADCLRRYEQRRRAGSHDGPALSALRVYRYGWRLVPESRRQSPDEAILLAEANAREHRQ